MSFMSTESYFFLLFTHMWGFNLSCHLPSGFFKRAFLVHFNKGHIEESSLLINEAMGIYTSP